MNTKSPPKTTLSNRLRSIFMVLIMLITSISIPKDIFATDLTATYSNYIKNLKVVVKQNGNVLDNGTTLEGKTPLDVEISFGIKAKSDIPTPANYIRKGDIFTMDLGLQELNVGTQPILISAKRENKLIATGTFTTDGKLKVDFNGDEDAINNLMDINLNFKANFKLNIDSTTHTTTQTKTIKILNESYTVDIMPQETVDIEKTGALDIKDGTIKWTLTVNTNRTDKVLKDYKVEDDLKDVGGYVDGTFKLYTTATTDYDTEKTGATPTMGGADGKTLTYTFGAGDKGPAKIEFKTALKSSEFAATYKKEGNTGHDATETNFFKELAKDTQKIEITKTNTATVKKYVELLKKTIEDSSTANVDIQGPAVSKAGNIAQNKKALRPGVASDGEDPAKKYIDWEIVYNGAKHNLTDVVIYDYFNIDTNYNATQKFVRAKVEESNGTNWVAFNNGTLTPTGGKTSIEPKRFKTGHAHPSPLVYIDPNHLESRPTGLEIDNYKDRYYHIGSVTGKRIKLTITTEVVPKLGINLDSIPLQFYNEVSVTSKEMKTVSIGNSVKNGVGKLILKDGKRVDGSRTDYEWTVKVKKSNIPDNKETYVYDMLIFDPEITSSEYSKLELDSGVSLQNGKTTVATDDFKVTPINTVLNKLIGDKNDIVLDNGLKAKTYKIYYNNAPNPKKYVGDLIEIYDWKSAKALTENAGKTELKATFKTYTTRPQNFEKEEQLNQVRIAYDNRVVDFDAKTIRDRLGRMLKKQVLTAENTQGVIDNINSYSNLKNFANQGIEKTTDNRDIAYNHNTKTAIFRLSVNADGHKNLKDTMNKDIIVEDTLPEGWVFKSLDGVNPYVLLPATEHSTEDDDKVATVVDKTSANTLTRGIDYEFMMPDDKTVKFTFKELKGPLVILLQAGPTDEKLKEYQKSSTSAEIENKSVLKVDLNNRNKVNPIYSNQRVRIDARLLSKGAISQDSSEIKWAIDYRPHDVFASATGTVYMIDKLGAGLELRRFADTGELAYDTLSLTEYDSIKPNGELEGGRDIPLDTSKVSYNQDTRELRINIPDKNKFYRFTYITDHNGGTVTNDVSIRSDSITTTEYQTISQRVEAGASGGATGTAIVKIKIKKTQEDNTTPITGAEFTLTRTIPDNAIMYNTYPMTKATLADGSALFTNIDEGEYDLTETITPNDYVKSGKVYKVVVRKLMSGNFFVKIDDKNDKNELEFPVINYKKPNLKIKKVDSINNTLLNGAKFTLQKVAPTPVDTTDAYATPVEVTTANDGTSDGMAEFIGLDLGRYELKETSAPMLTTATGTKEYNLDNTVRTIVVDGKGAISFPNDTADVNADLDTATKTITIKNEEYIHPTKDLEVFKKVAGDGANTSDLFKFDFKFEKEDFIGSGIFNSYDTPFDYEINGTLSGTVQNGNQLSIKANERIKVIDIPDNVRYTVTEVDYGEYTPSIKRGNTELGNIDNISGFVTTDPSLAPQFVDNQITFTNTKMIPKGVLRLGKTVTGTGANLNQKFEFTIELGTDPAKLYTYHLYRNDTLVEDGALRQIKSGDKVELAHNEYILINDVNVDTYYKITEKYVSDYTASVKKAELTLIDTVDAQRVATIDGNIVKEVTNTILYINDYYRPSEPDPPTPPPSTPPTTPPSTPPTPEVPPTTPPTPEEPPATPPTTPPTPEVPEEPTPGDTPEPPPTPPTPPDIPRYPIGDVPDPNDPGSPDEFTLIDEDGVPLGTYRRHKTPDGYEYILEEDVPLGSTLPRTGETTNMIYYLGGLALILIAMKKRRK